MKHDLQLDAEFVSGQKTSHHTLNKKALTEHLKSCDIPSGMKRRNVSPCN